jgi:hypothetical protein
MMVAKTVRIFPSMDGLSHLITDCSLGYRQANDTRRFVLETLEFTFVLAPVMPLYHKDLFAVSTSFMGL